MAPPAPTQSPVTLGGGARPHVMFIPSAGMGHLLPFFRFIAALASNHDVDISVVTVLPTVSAAEADNFAGLFAALPRVRRVDLHLLPFDASSEFPGHDPFLLRWEALRRSAHLLGPLIAGAAPRISAVVTDITLASHVIPIARDLRVQCHVLFVSCATMLSLLAYVPVHLDSKKKLAGEPLGPGVGVGDVDVPGVRRIPQSYLPQPLLDLNNLFTKQFIDNGREVANADGFLVNTFDALEPVALAALRDGKVLPGFPPVYAIGPLSSSHSHTSSFSDEPAAAGTGSPFTAWLDTQPARSVVYVAFGNRNAVSREQLREIAAGLEASGCRFLWVLKTMVHSSGRNFAENPKFRFFRWGRHGGGGGRARRGVPGARAGAGPGDEGVGGAGGAAAAPGGGDVPEPQRVELGDGGGGRRGAAAGVAARRRPPRERHGGGGRRRRGVGGALELGRGGRGGDRGGDRGEGEGGYERRRGEGEGSEGRRGGGQGRRRGRHELP